MEKRLCVCLAALFVAGMLLAAPSGAKSLPDWKKGEMDIHFINAESGEAVFCIFPDGTSMLIDSGETKAKNSPVPAYRIITDYVRHFLKPTGSDKIDYALLTHFHGDHFGDIACSHSNENGYAHMGMTAVYDGIKFGKIVDRAYPSYGADSTIYFKTPDMKGSTSGGVGDWISFVKFASRNGSEAERFANGSDSQFSMLRGGRGKYDFRVLNIGSNGEFIYKAEDGSIKFKQSKAEAENASSCCVLISYGNFDFLACGDLTGAPQNAFANYFLKTFNPSIELFKANHHLHHNAWGTGMMEVGFRPDVVVSPTWCATDPKHFPAPLVEKVASFCDLFAVSPKSAREYPDVFKKLKDYGGHFVVRVRKNGKFHIYKLNEKSSGYDRLAEYGPYNSYKN